MREAIQRELKLLPVRTAPFLAVGMILCAEGGTKAVMLVAFAAVLSVVAYYKRRTFFASAVALFCGMLLMTCYVSFWVQPILAFDGTTQQMMCTVKEKRDLGGYSGYTCRTEVGGRSTYITIYHDSSLEVGDRVSAEIKLSEIQHNKRSPVRRVLLKGSVRDVISVDRPQFSLLRMIYEFRQELSDTISAYMDDECNALAQGLLFGDTSSMTLKQSYCAQVSGVMHFTAVSGSHFVIIVSVLLEIFGERRKLRAAASVLCIPFVVIFFGAEPTVMRAGIMLFLCNCGPIFSRKSDTLNSLCVSLILMSAAPYVMLDIGFQMSVLGVFGVTVVAGGCKNILHNKWKIPKWLTGIVDALVTSACAVVCIAPISVSIFGGVSLVGVFATVVLAPVFSAALVLGVMLAASGIAAFAIPIGLLMKLACGIIYFFGADSRAWLVMDYDGAGMLALVSMLVLTAASVFVKSFGRKGVLVFGITAAIAVALSHFGAEFRRRIDFVSDGTSGAAVICTKDEAMIFIGGSGDGMESRLVNSLLENGIRHLRCVTVTEPTLSGALSLGYLNKLYPIDMIVSTDMSEVFARHCPAAEIIIEKTAEISVGGMTLAAAKAGDTECTADIVLYTSYKMSEPEYGAAMLPLYASSRQNILPEGGLNIYDTEFEIKLEN